MVRNEYKLWTYVNYFLPSKRFLLTIHNLTHTQLKSLDTLTDKSVKHWAGLPRSATNVMLHSKEGLNIKSISQLYMEAHTVSHVRTRTQGDTSVNNAVNCAIARESSWSTKKSIIVECEASYADALLQYVLQEVMSLHSLETSQLTFRTNSMNKSGNQTSHGLEVHSVYFF